jgi:serine/threonine protein kinase
LVADFHKLIWDRRNEVQIQQSKANFTTAKRCLSVYEQFDVKEAGGDINIIKDIGLIKGGNDCGGKFLLVTLNIPGRSATKEVFFLKMFDMEVVPDIRGSATSLECMMTSFFAIRASPLLAVRVVGFAIEKPMKLDSQSHISGIILENMAFGSIDTLLEKVFCPSEGATNTEISQTVSCLMNLSVRKYIALRIATILVELYRLNVAYNDMKPGQFVVDEEGNIKLIDFSVNCAPYHITMDEHLCHQCNFATSKPFSAPEPVNNAHTYHRDVFAAGLTIHTILTVGNEVEFIRALQPELTPDGIVNNMECTDGQPELLLDQRILELLKRCCSSDSTNRPDPNYILETLTCMFGDTVAHPSELAKLCRKLQLHIV